MSGIQQQIQRQLDEACECGDELGLQVAVYYQGELIVDAWAGTRDIQQSEPVTGDTLFPVFSTSKGITATIIHRLAERGLIDYDAPIAEYWPEFGCNKKETITLRHAMQHTAGLQNMPAGGSAMLLCDWNDMCSRIARLTPSWEPGTQVAYHAITYGWLLGEVACRVAGRSFGTILQDEICRPLGISSMYIGLPESLVGTVAELEDLIDRTAMIAAPDTDAIPGYVCPLHSWMNSPEGQRACAPASSGIMSARAIAKHYASLVPGGVDGVELLSAERVKVATKRGHLPDGSDLDRGLGYNLGGESGSTFGPLSTSFGTGGFGGSFGFSDSSQRFAIGFTKNRFSEKSIHSQVVAKVRHLLNLPS